MPEERKHEVVYADIDDLRIDDLNVRGGAWDRDPDFIRDVKEAGILQPILVRPDPRGITKYSIVCGSRRYNAALDAGLTIVPCIIKELNDKQAMARSYAENTHRKDVPKWQNIAWVGKMVEKFGFEETERITGHSPITIEIYWNIFNLPHAVKGLLRGPHERTKHQKEYLLKFTPYALPDKLSVGIANLIATELGDCTTERMMEVAVFLLRRNFTQKIAEILLPYVKLCPDSTVEDVYNEVVKTAARTHRVDVYFEDNEWKALSDVCIRRQMPVRQLIVMAIIEWLKNENKESS